MTRDERALLLTNVERTVRLCEEFGLDTRHLEALAAVVENQAKAGGNFHDRFPDAKRIKRGRRV